MGQGPSWSGRKPSISEERILDRIRKTMNVQATAQDKGLALTLKVVAYDNGMVSVDGVPINAEPNYEPVEGWLGATDVITTTLMEFYRQVQQRRN